MESRTSSPFAAGLMPGMYLAAALIVLRLLLYLLNVPMESPLNYAAWVVLALGMLWGVFDYRSRYCGGFLNYGGAFSSGFAIGLYASIVTAIFTYIYVSYIDTEMISQIMLTAEDKMLEQNPNMTDEEIEMALSMVERFSSPVMMAVMGFVYNVVISAIFSLIIAIFAKREDRSIA